MAYTYEKKRLYPKKEKDFLRDFMAEIQKNRPLAWFFKVHGEPMQVRGVPDVLICYSGMFVSIEFKVIRSGHMVVSPYQAYTMDLIKKAGGIAFIAAWNESTGKVHVGTKQFESKKDAAGHLMELLDILSAVPAKDIIDSL